MVFMFVGVDNGSGPNILNITTGTTEHSGDTILLSIDPDQIQKLGSQIEPLVMSGNAVQDLPIQITSPNMYNKEIINRLRDLCLKTKRTLH
jgi:hypothetical protein